MKVDKNFLKSKTMWTSLLVIVSGFFPEVQDFIKENPEEYAAILGGIFGLLRMTTKEKITLRK